MVPDAEAGLFIVIGSISLRRCRVTVAFMVEYAADRLPVNK